MMRLFGNVIKFLPVALLSTSALAANSDVAKVQLVDFSGKPPFKREVVELSVHDIAKLEAVSRNDEPLEYATVRTVDMRGKPPYRRTVETVPVYDIAKFEEVQGRATPRTGRPPFKRH